MKVVKRCFKNKTKNFVKKKIIKKKKQINKINLILIDS